MSERKKTRLTEEEQKLKERLMRSGGGVRRGAGRIPDDFWTMPRPKVSEGAALKALLDDRREGR